MKSKYVSLLVLATSLVLVSCNDNPTTSSTLDKTNDTSLTTDITTSVNEDVTSSHDTTDTSSSQTTTTTVVDDASISLISFGDVYYQGFRSVFAKVEGLTDYNLIWSSSNEDVIKVTAREGSKREAFLSAVGYGSADVIVSVEGRSDLTVSKTFTISKGEAMPESLYSKIDGGVKVSFTDKLYDFDEDFNKTLSYEYKGTTIFEEYNPSNTSASNLTDAYQIDVYDLTNPGDDDFHAKYVVTTGTKVGYEYISDKNTVETDRYLNEDDEEINWEYSYYVNLLNEQDPDYGWFGRENFRTFDNGKTYHYVGGYLGSSYLMANYLLLDISLDDMYFKIGEDNSISLVGLIDPYNSEDAISEERYGRELYFTYSEFDIATIEHLTPYEHKDYHDRIDQATLEMSQAKNYVAEITYEYESDPNYNFKKVFTFTEDTIDEVTLDMNGNVTAHSGIHASDENTYIEYSYNDDTKALSITETHNQAWDAVNRYPTFEFASEIFTTTSTDQNVFVTIDDCATFIQYCCYLSTAAKYATYIYPGTITLSSDNHLLGFYAQAQEYGESTPLTITGTFKEVGTASVDIDFESDIVIPTSWEEDMTADRIYDTLVLNGILDRVPYLYSSVGYADPGWTRTNDPVDFYITTKEFNSEEDRDSFINSYISLMTSTYGYVDSGSTMAEYPYKMYTNDKGYIFGIGPELNWRDEELMSVKIVFVFEDFDYYEIA